jgi:hypothetical protein
MAYEVAFAPTAIARLEDIVRYIAADDPATASTFAMHLLDRAKRNYRRKKEEWSDWGERHRRQSCEGSSERQRE